MTSFTDHPGGQQPVNWWGRQPIFHKIAAIPLVFLVGIALLQVVTTYQIKQLRGDTVVTDVAGRQRFLVRESISFTLMRQQGKNTPWERAVLLFQESADRLRTGGVALVDRYAVRDEDRYKTLPPASTDVIRRSLDEQSRQMAALRVQMEAYARIPEGDPRARREAEEMLAQASELEILCNRTTKAFTASSRDKVETMMYFQAFAGFSLALVGLAFSVLVARQITERMGVVVEQARRIGSGNLRSAKLPVTSSDETGRLAQTFNQMQDSLRSLALQTRATTENLNAAAAEILASAQQQAAATSEQAAAVQQTTTTMEQIRRSGEQISEKARRVAASAEATSAASVAGLDAVQGASRTMQTIQEQAGAVADNVVALSEKTRAMGDIISTVNGIAEQSHLLALNASIEAAGAGESGRRFSVVAEEMKNLADQSRDATIQVRSILGDIQNQINSSVMLTEEAVKRVERGQQQSGTALRAIQQMADNIQQSINAFEQIAAATNQQQIGFEQVAQAAQQIRVTVDQASVGTRQLEEATLSLNDLSQQLRERVEAYEL